MNVLCSYDFVVMYSIASVSYTHLDVYKRQPGEHVMCYLYVNVFLCQLFVVCYALCDCYIIIFDYAYVYIYIYIIPCWNLCNYWEG